MEAVILAGGRGTRFYPFDAVLPKALAPIEGRPMLQLCLGSLRDGGITHATIITGHLGWMITEFVRRNPTEGLSIDLIEEKTPLGNAGALRQLGDIGEEFILVNCDVHVAVDFRDLIKFHRSQRSLITIVTVIERETLLSGVLDVNPQGQVVRFSEKPEVVRTINAGIYVISRQALDHLPRQSPCMMNEWIEGLIRRQERILAYQVSTPWVHITTVNDLLPAPASFKG